MPWQDRLHALDAALRAAGLPHGPDRWLRAHTLLHRLGERDALPSDGVGLCRVLAPLFCRDAAEQRLFTEVFDVWWTSGDEAGGAAKEAEQNGTGDARAGGSGIRHARLWPWLLMACVVATVLLLGEVLNRLPAPCEACLATVPVPPKQTVSDCTARSDCPDPIPPAQELKLSDQPLPARPSADAPPALMERFAQWRQLVPLVLSLVLGPFALAYLLYAWRARRVALEQRPDDLDAPFAQLEAHHAEAPLFDGPTVRDALRRLHATVAQPTRRLHSAQTVEQTLRAAGLFTPVYRERAQVPEVLLLVDAQHDDDPLLRLSESLAVRLRETDLHLAHYRFLGEPRWLRQVGEERGVPFESVAARYPGARVLVIGRRETYINRIDGAPAPWLKAMDAWQQGYLFSVDAEPGFSSGLGGPLSSLQELGTQDARHPTRPLEESGLLLAPLSSSGLEAMGAHLRGQRAVADLAARPLPPKLRDAHRWQGLDWPRRDERRTLVEALGRYLDADGLRVLRAIAAYPQFHWGLLRALDIVLDPQCPDERREARLLRMARLPWAREGWMPLWLRWQLLSGLKRGEYREVAAILRTLFLPPDEAETAGADRRAIPLDVRLKRRRQREPWGWLSTLKAWFDKAPRDSAASDQIFARLVTGGFTGRLSFLLPPGAGRLLLGLFDRASHRRALGLMRPLLFTVSVVVLVAGFWQWRGAQWLDEALFAQQRGLFSDTELRIEGAPIAERWLQALWRIATEDGFGISSPPEVAASPDLSPQQVPEARFAEALVHHSSDELDVARFLGERFRTLAYGASYTLMPDSELPAGQMRIEIRASAGPGEGTGFRDPMNLPLDLGGEGSTQRLKALVDELVNGNASESDAAIEDLIALLRVFENSGDLSQRETITAFLTAWDEYTVKDAAGGFSTGNEEERRARQRTIGKLIDTVRTLTGSSPRQKAPEEQISTGLGDTEEIPYIEPDMIDLPGGRFEMGCVSGVRCRSNEKPVHAVVVAPFAMAVNEVTFEAYDLFARAENRELPDDRGWGRGRRPVIDVSWDDAQAYARWLSDRTGKTYRLPTEAEWEYAARAGTKTPFWSGDCIHTDRANYLGNYDFNDCVAMTGGPHRRTVSVDELDAANAFGLRHMAGNVWEWTADCWHENYSDAPVDSGAWLDANDGDCTRRVLRGGGWNDQPENLRSANRYWLARDAAFSYGGLRLARTP
ncbi:MAG: SUMF1/EgtB/PvdO family nonheme iron enzyme [Gammaproteobacteria bacterium]